MTPAIWDAIQRRRSLLAGESPYGEVGEASPFAIDDARLLANWLLVLVGRLTGPKPMPVESDSLSHGDAYWLIDTNERMVYVWRIHVEGRSRGIMRKDWHAIGNEKSGYASRPDAELALAWFEFEQLEANGVAGCIRNYGSGG